LELVVLGVFLVAANLLMAQVVFLGLLHLLAAEQVFKAQLEILVAQVAVVVDQ
jgi:hypothetical protein